MIELLSAALIGMQFALGLSIVGLTGLATAYYLAYLAYKTVRAAAGHFHHHRHYVVVRYSQHIQWVNVNHRRAA